MKLIQLILIFSVGLTIVVARRKKGYFSRTFSRFGFLFALSIFIIGVLFPDILQWVAEFVGVGRGADLLLYLSATTLFSGILLIFVKIKQIEAREIIIVRELALQQVADSKEE